MVALSGNSKRLMRILSLAVFVGFMTFLVSQSVGLFGKGFDTASILEQANFYVYGAVFLFLVVLVGFIFVLDRRGDGQYGDSIFFASPGDFPSIPIFKRFSQIQIFILSAIIFPIVGLISFFVLNRQTSFIGIGQLEQQFTPTAELLFSSLLVPGAENLGFALVLAVSALVVKTMAVKFDWRRESYRILAWGVLPLIGAFYWFINHTLRYSGQDFNLLIVFFFGYVMGLITVLSGSFIPAWIMHISNNLFIGLKQFYSSDLVIASTIIVLLIAAVFYWFLYRTQLFGRKGGE